MTNADLVMRQKDLPVDGSIISYEQKRELSLALDAVLSKNVDGEVVELGCYVGESSKILRRTLDITKSDKRLHVYDSFEGLPPLHDCEKNCGWKPGTLNTTEDVLVKNFQRNGLEPPIICKGWFKDIPDDKLPQQICFAFLDGDFYDSIYDSLIKIYDRVVNGGIVLFHDYGRADLPGVETAVKNFFESRNIKINPKKHCEQLWSITKGAENAEHEKIEVIKVEEVKNIISTSQSMHSTTLVTGLFDLKRGELDTGFKRPFSQYLMHFERLLKACKDTPMLVYVDKEHEQFVLKAREGSVGTDIRFRTAEEFKTWFPFYNKVNEIRQKPEWYNQAGWLAESTQARLDLYNPLVMSKMFMLHDASIFNPFDTDNFCWIDAGLTQTVHPGYFSHDKVIERLDPLLQKFLFVCYPYESNAEIHGFTADAMNKYANAKVNRVARGGFFGGSKKAISQVNTVYYSLLNETLNAGYMGTEESVFSLITYLNPELTNIEMIDGNGFVSTFFERVKKLPIPKKEVLISKSEIPEGAEYFQSEEEVAMNKEGKGTYLYITCFNYPQQLQMLLDTFEESNPELLSQTTKFLIDNSVDESAFPKFDEIAKKHNFTVIRKGNLGVCGARQWAAQHFHDNKGKYIVWFEDDMLMEKENVVCKNGLAMHCDNWLNKCIKIVEEEKLDFLKISFSEFFGDHHKQWSWHNVPQVVKNKYFPDGKCRMRWKETGCIDGLSYLIGEVYYSNWPSVLTRAANYKIFLETVYAAPFEQTIMSHCFQLTKKGRIRSAVLMASLVNHNRVHHYDRGIRKEV